MYYYILCLNFIPWITAPYPIPKPIQISKKTSLYEKKNTRNSISIILLILSYGTLLMFARKESHRIIPFSLRKKRAEKIGFIFVSRTLIDRRIPFCHRGT